MPHPAPKLAKSKPRKGEPPVLKSVRIEDIKVPRSRRPLGDVTELAASIKEVGLLHPILVAPDMTLLAGAHRLEACRRLGHECITASVVELSRLHRELVTLDENLVRKELTELDRARALRRQKEIYEALHPETRSVTRRGGPGRGHKKTSDKVAVVLPFSRESARKTGLSPRSVERSIQIADGLDSETVRLIERTWLASSQSDLLRLARLDVTTRRKVAKLIASGAVVHIKAALQEVQREALIAKDDGSKRNRNKFAVHVGDFALVATKHIDDDSIDLIVTDPQWDHQAALKYDALAAVAERVLKPGGVIAAVIGQDHLPGLLQALSARLTYVWTLCLQHPRRCKQHWPGGIMSRWTPVLLFTKGKRRFAEFSGDVLRDDAVDGGHRWEKAEEAVRNLVHRYSAGGGLVFDPYMGSGSSGVAALQLGRRFVGADVDPKAVALARARLADAKWADPAAVISCEAPPSKGFACCVP